MPRKQYIEKTSHGREQAVRTRSPSHRHTERNDYRSTRGNPSTDELIDKVEVTKQDPTTEVLSLQNQLSIAQWHLEDQQIKHQRFINEHYECRHIRRQLEEQIDKVERLEDLLSEEEDNCKKLEHKNKKLKGKNEDLKEYNLQLEGERDQASPYERWYEVSSAEVEMLKREMAKKNSTIEYLKNLLRSYRIIY